MSRNIINKYAVQVDGGFTFNAVHNDIIDALKKAKRLAIKERRTTYVVRICKSVTPGLVLKVQDGRGETIEEA